MAEEKQQEEKPRSSFRSIRFIIVIALLIAFAGVTTFAVMSDTSIHGLTLRFYNNVSRYCNMTGPSPVLTFNFYTVTVYSSNSLTTSLTHVTFTMSTDGLQVGTVSETDARFDPGHSYSYYVIFSNPTLDPHSQPLLSQIVLTINARAGAGLYSSQVSASDSELVHFLGQAC